MTDMHPHWETTEHSAVRVSRADTPVTDIVEDGSPVAIAEMNVSRRPAAIVGIALVTVLGYVFLHGVERLTGALSAQVEVVIAETGLDPQTINVVAGGEITWLNTLNAPTELVSRTLCNQSSCLASDSVNPGERTTYHVPADVPPGTYAYGSPFNPRISGVIVVRSAGDAVASVPETAAPPPPSTPPRQVQPPVASPPPTPAPPPPAPVPHNPNRVDTKQTNPVQSVHAAATGKGKGKPFRQPETGPGLWLVALGTLLGLHVATRRYFRSVDLNKKFIQ